MLQKEPSPLCSQPSPIINSIFPPPRLAHALPLVMPFLCVLPTVSSREYLKLGPHPTQRGPSQPEPFSQPASWAADPPPPDRVELSFRSPVKPGSTKIFLKFSGRFFSSKFCGKTPSKLDLGLFFVNFAVPAGSFRASRRTHSPGPQGPHLYGCGVQPAPFFYHLAGWASLKKFRGPQEIPWSLLGLLLVQILSHPRPGIALPSFLNRLQLPLAHSNRFFPSYCFCLRWVFK